MTTVAFPAWLAGRVPVHSVPDPVNQTRTVVSSCDQSQYTHAAPGELRWTEIGAPLSASVFWPITMGFRGMNSGAAEAVTAAAIAAMQAKREACFMFVPCRFRGYNPPTPAVAGLRGKHTTPPPRA